MITTIQRHIRRQQRRIMYRIVNPIRVAGKPKIFCIGRNKTGTTSMKRAMQELGFTVGNQRQAELLIDDWARGDFRRLIRLCKSAQFFQDAPFSYPFTYIIMDQAFKGSKFILTVRDSAEKWYNSLVRFHARKWGKNGCPPTKKELQNARYRYRGWAWHANRIRAITPDDDLYNKELLIRDYERHNENVLHYFRHRPDDLLILNVAEKNSYRKLTDFLGIPPARSAELPWENKTM